MQSQPRMTRQQQRYLNRRSNKPDPAEVNRTSRKHALIRTKGLPYSTKYIVDVNPSLIKGVPSKVTLGSYTKKGTITRTLNNQMIDLFFPNIEPKLKLSLLGF